MKVISAEELDRLFDEGSDEIDQYMDWSKAVRLGDIEQVVSVPLSKSIVEQIDRAAEAEGTDRRAVIQAWLADKAAAVSA